MTTQSPPTASEAAGATPSDAALALLGYAQADEDGVMVLASRQAIHEVIGELSAARQRIAGLEAELHIVFDGPPSHESGRFVEVETADGNGMNVGRWEQRGNYWHLIIGGKK